MSAGVTVTQADRDAVQAFHHAMAEKLMADITSGKPPTLGDDAGHDGDSIHQAFARHRLATEAEFAAREAALVEAAEWLRAISAWLLKTDNDLALPRGILDTDPLDIADRLSARAHTTSEGEGSVVGDLDGTIPNRFDHTKRGFQP